MELTAYLHPGWAPLIRPAPATRPWMDATPDSFAYRCLPLNIANAHGWEILCPCGFEAVWDGEATTGAVTIRPDDGAQRVPVSHFGQGTITFHIEAIFRTPPGWNLWVTGSPNRQKDAIQPLSAVVETDWSPFTFTMNWRFTRPAQWIRFEAFEPFCFVFPVERTSVEAFRPAFAPLGANPGTQARFRAWSEARDTFHAKLKSEPPRAKAEGWQKHYYRGVDVSGETLAPDHRPKLRLRPFDRSGSPDTPMAPNDDVPEKSAAQVRPQASDPIADRIGPLNLALARREWLLNTLERQRDLAPGPRAIERREGMGSWEFLERYYAVGRPVILVREIDGWPALSRWNPAYLKARIGSAPIAYQGELTGNPEAKNDFKPQQAAFDALIDAIEKGACASIAPCDSDRNKQVLAPLGEDIGSLDKFLSRESPSPAGMLSISPAGALTSLHHELANVFIAQVVGRSKLKLLPASQVGALYNNHHVFSEIRDLEDPALDPKRYPRLAEARAYDVTLEPGEILFMPLAWWHQVRSLDFSVTSTFTNFLWPNDGHATYPSG
ncbi:MAG TPA: DUF6065 family protein [Caulobacteraceae bacterium]